MKYSKQAIFLLYAVINFTIYWANTEGYISHDTAVILMGADLGGLFLAYVLQLVYNKKNKK